MVLTLTKDDRERHNCIASAGLTVLGLTSCCCLVLLLVLSYFLNAMFLFSCTAC